MDYISIPFSDFPQAQKQENNHAPGWRDNSWSTVKALRQPTNTMFVAIACNFLEIRLVLKIFRLFEIDQRDRIVS
jgi:hypothetical protein